MRRKTILLSLFLLGCFPIVNSQQKQKTALTPKVEVYYFYPTERCPIDLTIEENVKTTVQTWFSKEIKNGTMVLQMLNTDDKANAKTVARFDMNAQALYIVKHDKGKELKTDLTEFAFSCSQNNPSKFKARLKDEIENALISHE
jgi:hypothetical protein